MASIGPQLPAHLLKQQHRTGSNGSGSSDDEEGPQPEASTSVSAGPQVPAHLLCEKPTVPIVNDDEDDDDDDSYGPALPPDLLPSRPKASSSASTPGPSAPSPPSQSRRVLGPSLPGHDKQTYGDDEDDEDGYGPMPLPAYARNTDTVSEGVREFLEKEEKRQKEIEEAAKPKRPKRDEWMLVPPSSSDILGRLSDPTKLKARQFSRGAGAAARSAPNNLWTETPAERQQRIADEVAGKKRRAANADEDAAANPEDDRKKRKRDSDIRRVVDEHNKSARGKTLLELHETEAGGEQKAKKGKDKDDEGPPVIWDHARDMSLGGRLMDEKQRSKLIADARSLGDRFGSGKAG
ncbi:hypothetical protein DFH11DRAFT_1463507, partial [Phellopilus nigrolimitatus]